MSKSAESDASRINLLDPPDVLYGKIKRAKTDGKPLSGPCQADVHARSYTAAGFHQLAARTLRQC